MRPFDVGPAPLFDLTLSPDGTRLAYVTETNGKSRILVRRLDELEARPIAGTDDACCIFFSPDSR